MLSVTTERRSMAMAQHSAVLGNVSDDLKHLAVKALARFIGTTATSYGAEIGQRLRLTEINIWERVGFPQEAQTVCEIEVRKGENSNSFQRCHHPLLITAYRYV